MFIFLKETGRAGILTEKQRLESARARAREREREREKESFNRHDCFTTTLNQPLLDHTKPASTTLNQPQHRTSLKLNQHQTKPV